MRNTLPHKNQQPEPIVNFIGCCLRRQIITASALITSC
jgi:hypothetical protein